MWPEDKFRIRLVTEYDLTSLEWDGEYSHYRYLYRDVYKKSLLGETILWMAEGENKIMIGQIFVQLFSARSELANGKSRAYLFGFRVKPAYRYNGVGTRLLRNAEDDLLNRGFQHTTLNVNRDNGRARNFYERLGYQVVAEEAGEWTYIDLKGELKFVHEPAWRMEKMLIPGSIMEK